MSNSKLKRGDNSYCPPLAGVQGVGEIKGVGKVKEAGQVEGAGEVNVADGKNTSDENPLGLTPEPTKIIQKKPYVYQIIDGKKVEREGRFVIRDRRPSSVKGTRYTGTNNGHGQRCIYGFQVASYDKRYPLVIDPTIAYSTYLGGSDIDAGYGIAVDSAGNAYVMGSTYSTDFPIVGTTTAYGGGGYADAFVTKIAAGCKPKKMTIVKDPKQLVQGESGTITVTLTGKKGCISSGYTVTSKVVAGKNKLAISPSSAVTDAGGVAEFTMTAASDKKGIATVRFKTGKLKKDVSVKIKKK